MTPAPIDLKVVGDRLRLVSECLEKLRTIPATSLEEFRADPRNAPAVESLVRHAIEALFDTARHILAKRFGLGALEYREVARVSGDHGLIVKPGPAAAVRRDRRIPEPHHSLLRRSDCGGALRRRDAGPRRPSGDRGGAATGCGSLCGRALSGDSSQTPDASFLSLAPDWVCEVVSPSTERADRVLKLPSYARHRVGHAWLVNPASRTLEVYRREGEAWMLASSHADDAVVRGEPFDEVELDLLVPWGESRPEERR